MGIERHGSPAMGGTWRNPDRIGSVSRGWIDDGPAGLRIESAPPAAAGEWSGENECAVRAIQHVEDAAFARLHDDFTGPPIDRDVGERQLLDVVVIPFIPGNRLVVPRQIAALRLDRKNGAYIEVVETLAAAQFRRPRRAVAGPD